MFSPRVLLIVAPSADLAQHWARSEGGVQSGRWEYVTADTLPAPGGNFAVVMPRWAGDDAYDVRVKAIFARLSQPDYEGSVKWLGSSPTDRDLKEFRTEW